MCLHPCCLQAEGDGVGSCSQMEFLRAAAELQPPSTARTPPSPWTAFLQARSFISRGKVCFIWNYNVPHEKKKSYRPDRFGFGWAGLHCSKMKVPSKYPLLKQRQSCYKALLLAGGEIWKITAVLSLRWHKLEMACMYCREPPRVENSPSSLGLNTATYRHSKWPVLFPSPSTPFPPQITCTPFSAYYIIHIIHTLIQYLTHIAMYMQ